MNTSSIILRLIVQSKVVPRQQINKVSQNIDIYTTLRFFLAFSISQSLVWVSVSPLWVKWFKAMQLAASNFFFFMFSMETESKCCYSNAGKIHLLILVHKFDLIPSAVLRDQRLIPHLWIIHRQTCGMSGVIHLCKQKRSAGVAETSHREIAKLWGMNSSGRIHQGKRLLDGL